jgi:hypothetical protein
LKFEYGITININWNLGEECSKKVSKFLAQGIPKKSIGNLRKMIKAELTDEIKEIDGIVRRILGI